MSTQQNPNTLRLRRYKMFDDQCNGEVLETVDISLDTCFVVNTTTGKASGSTRASCQPISSDRPSGQWSMDIYDGWETNTECVASIGSHTTALSTLGQCQRGLQETQLDIFSRYGNAECIYVVRLSSQTPEIPEVPPPTDATTTTAEPEPEEPLTPQPHVEREAIDVSPTPEEEKAQGNNQSEGGNTEALTGGLPPPPVSPAAIAGIVAAVVVPLIIVAIVVGCVCYQKRRKARQNKNNATSNINNTTTTTTTTTDIDAGNPPPSLSSSISATSTVPPFGTNPSRKQTVSDPYGYAPQEFTTHGGSAAFYV